MEMVVTKQWAFPLALILLAGQVVAQDSPPAAAITRTPADGTAQSVTSASAAQNSQECSTDGGVTNFLSCTKAKFTTTELVGAGIAVTVVIFGIAFGIIFFIRSRKSKRPMNTKTRSNENADRAEKGKNGKQDKHDLNSDSDTDSDLNDETEDESDNEDKDKKKVINKKTSASNGGQRKQSDPPPYQGDGNNTGTEEKTRGKQSDTNDRQSTREDIKPDYHIKRDPKAARVSSASSEDSEYSSSDSDTDSDDSSDDDDDDDDDTDEESSDDDDNDSNGQQKQSNHERSSSGSPKDTTPIRDLRLANPDGPQRSITDNHVPKQPNLPKLPSAAAMTRQASAPVGIARVENQTMKTVPPLPGAQGSVTQPLNVRSKSSAIPPPSRPIHPSQGQTQVNGQYQTRSSTAPSQGNGSRNQSNIGIARSASNVPPNQLSESASRSRTGPISTAMAGVGSGNRISYAAALPRHPTVQYGVEQGRRPSGASVGGRPAPQRRIGVQPNGSANGGMI